MDSQVTLTTSDDPPVSVSISRYALMAHSKVFADMLSLDLKAGETPLVSLPVFIGGDRGNALLGVSHPSLFLVYPTIVYPLT